MVKENNKTPFNLSEKGIRKVVKYNRNGKFNAIWVYHDNDVKEFIKLLKEEQCECNYMDEDYKCELCKQIDKLAGADLIK